jgi:ubiquinone biosynthesis protein
LILLENNVIGLVDFGMVGRIDETLREQIEDMLMAIVNRDGEQLTTLIVRLGAAPADLDYAALGTDVSEFVSHYAQQSLRDFNLSAALNEMTEIIRRYQIMLPARIAMLLKVLVMLEGASRLISPSFSLMAVMQPYRKKMLWRRISPARRLRKAKRIYSELEHLAQTLPRRLGDIVRQVQTGNFDVHLDHRGLEPSVNRLVLGMLASALFLGSSLLLTHKSPPLFHDVSILGVSGAVVSLALGLRLLRAINKSGHLDRRR